MKQMIFTIVGQDKPGLVESLAQLVFEYEGNWLASNFAHMAGNFAGFVQIELPTVNKKALLDKFSHHPDLHIHLVPAQVSPTSSEQHLTIDIMGNDKPGIVQELTQTLSRLDLNILRFTSSCGSAPNWGGILFKASVAVTCNQNQDTDHIKEVLENLGDDLMVDINFEA